MTGCTYSFQCPACGKIETDNNKQAFIIIMPKNGCRPRTYEICSECRQDMYDLMEGRGPERIAKLEHEQEERIPVSLWGHHE